MNIWRQISRFHSASICVELNHDYIRHRCHPSVRVLNRGWWLPLDLALGRRKLSAETKGEEMRKAGQRETPLRPRLFKIQRREMMHINFSENIVKEEKLK